MASAGSLVFELAADVSRLRTDMQKAQAEMKSSLDSIARNTAISGAKAGFDFAMAFARGFADKIKQAVDQADALGKLSERIGTTTEQLSALTYAGQFADVSAEDLTTGFKNLNKALLEARDPASNSAAAFKAMGLDIEKLKSEDPAQAFTDVAEAFSKFKDGAEKGAVATQVFGKEGQKLIPLLNEGADGIAAATAEAENLGMIVSTKTAQDMAVFNDQLTTLENITTGLAQQLASALVPALTDVTNMMIEANSTGTPLQNAFMWIGKQATLTAIDIASLAAEVKMFIKTAMAWDQIGGQVLEGKFGDAKKTYDEMRKANDEGYAELKRRKEFALQQAEYRFDPSRQAEQNAWAVVQARADRQGKETMRYTETLDKNAKAHKSAAKAVDEYANMLKSLQDQYRTTAAEGDPMKLLTSDPKFLAMGKAQQQVLIDQTKANVDLKNSIEARKQAEENAHNEDVRQADEARKKWQAEEEHANQIWEWAEQAKRAQDPIIEYTEHLEKASEALKAGAFTQAQYNEELKRAADTYKQAKEGTDPYIQALKKVEDAINAFGKKASDTFVDFIFGSKEASVSFSEMVTSMLKDIAKMLVYQNVIGPLFQGIGKGATGGGWNWANFMPTGGGLMAGGLVSPGVMYPVNELPGRKEYFIPNVPGRVVTDANSMGGSNVTVNVRMAKDDKSTEDTEANDRNAAELGKRIASVVKQVLVTEKRAGGLLASPK